jgi:hydrogenase expression/formation protein HypE
MKAPDTIQLAHGGGGLMTRDLIAVEIVSRFAVGPAADLPDAAALDGAADGLLFTTDGFVVHPFEFPGGNIGSLAVHGSVNDIAVAGGVPLVLSLGLILEEGLPLAALRRVLDAARDAAAACGVRVATGDTKVVPRGLAAGIYVNTACIGRRLPGFALSAAAVQPGDEVIVSGTLGDHGMAVMSAREGMGLMRGPDSDSAPVHRLVAAIGPQAAAGVHFMRDPTRGGLAAVLNEMAEGRSVDVLLDEAAIPLDPRTAAVAELLGIEPLQSASEGRIVLIGTRAVTAAVLAAWQVLPEGRGACRVGSVVAGHGRVILETRIGGRRMVDLPRGEMLPRIC